MLRNTPAAAMLALAVVFTAITPTGAVTAGGEPDAQRHPYVGLMVAHAADGTPLWRCSGTLLSPTLFLTAGHCTESPAAHVEIWFDEDMESNQGSNGYPFDGDVGGRPYTHPSYNPSAFFLFDLGVVVLDSPMVMSEYGALPELNVLDRLKKPRGQQDVTFTAVGYGLQESFPDPAMFLANNQKVRMLARPHLLQINTALTGDFSILLSNNTHTGGTCFGDSGGPNFIGDSNVIAGITSFGMNGNCAGTGGVYRVDRADDLDFLYNTFGGHLTTGKARRK